MKLHAYKKVKVSDLKPTEGNPRTHSPEQIAQLQRSIKEFGFTNPLLIDEHNMVLAGHGRLMAAIAEGMEELPVIEVASLTDEQKQALLLADNQLAVNAAWDNDLLRSVLANLDAASFDLSVIGFSEEELQMILAPIFQGGNTDPDDIPETPEHPVSQSGDIWELGSHRLCCGDSTDQKQMDILMSGKRAVVSITDPPYSVKYEESHKIRGGKKSVHLPYHEGDDPTNILKFLGTIPTDLLIWSFSVNRHMFQVVDALKLHKWEIKKELIWVKDSFSFWMGAAYQQKHEPFWICAKNNASFRGNVDSKDSTVLEYPRPKAHELHPTAKPIELWKKLVSNHSNPNELIVDPFNGSGTSIIAAETLNRICYAMEISPTYVDVAVERWQKFTNKKATLNGIPFDQVKEERSALSQAQAIA